MPNVHVACNNYFIEIYFYIWRCEFTTVVDNVFTKNLGPIAWYTLGYIPRVAPGIMETLAYA